MPASASPRPPAVARGWVVVVPVKSPARAKSRLQWSASPDRAELARALALDTVEAIRATPTVDEVVVVTDDEAVAEAARELGSAAVADTGSGDLDTELAAAVVSLAQSHPHARFAAVLADLPSLTPTAFARVLSDASECDLAYVPDAEATGTTMLLSADLDGFLPRFGPGSARRHAEAGAVAVALDVAVARRDVDTVEDLHAAQRLGVGPRTAHVLATALSRPA